MNLRNLRTFVAIVDAGGLARAAVQLNLSQPAASRQLSALEAELGIALFDRIGKRIHLTPEGEDLLERGRRLLADATSFGDRARALKAGQVGTLRIGAPTQVIENVLAPFVPLYQARHPGIEVVLLEAAAGRLQGYLDRGDAHLGVLPSGHDALHGELLYPIYVTAVLAKAHPLARRRVLEIAKLNDAALLVVNRQFGLRAWFEAACEVAHVRPRVLMESAAPQTLIALARESYGVAIVPSDTRIIFDDVRMVPLVQRGISIGRWAVVAWDPRRFMAPFTAQFVQELIASVRRTFPGHRLLRGTLALPRPKEPST